jgi:brain-specific serine protease 4
VGAGNDIAVIELEKPLTDELTAGRVCMPYKPIAKQVGKTATLAGWGRTKNDSNLYPTLLHSLDMKVLKDCMKVPEAVGVEK